MAANMDRVPILIKVQSHPTGTVLPFSSAAYNVKSHVSMCWRFRVFCSKYNVIFFRFRARSALPFACTDCYGPIIIEKCCLA